MYLDVNKAVQTEILVLLRRAQTVAEAMSLC